VGANIYAYAGGNQISGTDPPGLFMIGFTARLWAYARMAIVLVTFIAGVLGAEPAINVPGSYLPS